MVEDRSFSGKLYHEWGWFPVQLDVLLPAAAGVVATLVVVVLGGVLTRRQQVEAWSRDRSVGASIVRESTRIQLCLERVYAGRGATLDWTPWNESLAILHLVGHPETVAAVQKMDEAFWRYGEAIKHDNDGSYEAWEALRDPIEATRLEFINIARHHLLMGKQPLSRLVARVAVEASDLEQPGVGSQAISREVAV